MKALSTILFQETSHLFLDLCQLVHTREVNDTEMVWFLPVKAATMNQENLFLLQEIKNELFIIINAVHITVNFREDIKTRLRLDCR